MPSPTDQLTDLIGKGYDLDLDDALAISVLSTRIEYEDACRVCDAVRLIICDPLYKGDIPFDYFDAETD